MRFLKEYFGARPLRAITWQDLADLKSKRIRQPVIITHVDRVDGPDGVYKRERIETRNRSIASVQQPLKLARRMFNVAIRLGWMSENPFDRGDALIITAHEKRRARVLSHDEETKLLDVCAQRLADAIVVAIDTAARENEMLTLNVCDVYLDRRYIYIRGHNAKTEEPRLVPITARMTPVLDRLLAAAAGARLFPAGTREYIDRHFRDALELAGIDDFQWRDLRHTGTSRLVRRLKNPVLAMKVTGHTNYKTFIKTYVNLDEETIREMVDALDANQSAPISPAQVSEGVN